MTFSPHFESHEFELSGDPVPPGCEPVFGWMCVEVLEPIRGKWGVPIRVTSGYRSPEGNQAAGGQPKSQHIATPDYCACDFTMARDLQVVFDWLRLISGLPFDQTILEREEWGGPPVCIHVSYVMGDHRRIAGEMLTRGRGPYKQMEVDEVPATNIATTAIEDAEG